MRAHQQAANGIQIKIPPKIEQAPNTWISLGTRLRYRPPQSMGSMYGAILITIFIFQTIQGHLKFPQP